MTAENKSRPILKYDLSPEGMIHSSMQSFAEYVSGDALTDYMRGFKKDPEEEDHSFQLHASNGRQYTIIDAWSDGEFFLDGNHAFALGVDRLYQERLRWVAVVGFFTGGDFDNELNYYSLKFRDTMATLEKPAPVIVQLQGANDETYKETGSYPAAREVLAKYKWERALIGMVEKWAQATGANRSFVMPSDNIKWMLADHPERLKLRYDVSAQRMGFKMQSNGLYGKSLQ